MGHPFLLITCLSSSTDQSDNIFRAGKFYHNTLTLTSTNPTPHHSTPTHSYTLSVCTVGICDAIKDTLVLMTATSTHWICSNFNWPYASWKSPWTIGNNLTIRHPIIKLFPINRAQLRPNQVIDMHADSEMSGFFKRHNAYEPLLTKICHWFVLSQCFDTAWLFYLPTLHGLFFSEWPSGTDRQEGKSHLSC